MVFQEAHKAREDLFGHFFSFFLHVFCLYIMVSDVQFYGICVFANICVSVYICITFARSLPLCFFPFV